MSAATKAGSTATGGATANKYDRQIRMWGAHGQAALAQSRICLLTAGATGVEVVKNLVLPCVGEQAAGGYVMVVDDAKVSARDLGNNFFVTVEDLSSGAEGEPLDRCEAVAKNLMEMNSEVDCRHHSESPATIATTDPAFFEQFTCIVASDMAESSILPIAALCASLGTPLFVVRSYGLLGYIRFQAAEHVVVEGKPMSEIPDLRLREPWAELEALASEFNLGTLAPDGDSIVELGALSHVEHQQVPAPLVAVSLASGVEGKGMKWKKAFKKHVRFFSAKWTRAYKAAHPELLDAEGKWPASMKSEPNFDQAASLPLSVLSTYTNAPGPFDDCEEFDAILERSEERVASLKQLQGESGESASSESSAATPALRPIPLFVQKFWICAEALRRFRATEGGGKFLPLAGDLPDYAGTSEMYIKVEECYRAKADVDCAALTAHVAAILADCSMPPDLLTSEELKRFSKSSRNARAFTRSSIVAEYGAGGMALAGQYGEGALEYFSEWEGENGSTTQCPLIWYVAMRVADRFNATHGHFPGFTDEQFASDEVLLRAKADEVMDELDLPREYFTDDHVKETLRWGAATIASVASWVGGVAASELAKVLTHQFAPMNNTVIFNGITGKAATYQM